MTVLMVKTLSRCLKFSQMALNILIRVMLNKKPVYWFDDYTKNDVISYYWMETFPFKKYMQRFQWLRSSPRAK